MRNDYGYSGLMDLRAQRISGIHGLAGLGGIGQIAAPFLYVPDLAPVGSGAAYFPRSVAADANALNYLGFLDDASLASLFPSAGSQARDMDQESGAWDPDFRAGITRFQAAKGLTVDSWVGPQTRTALAVAVTAKNASGIPSVPVPALPPAVLPVNPGTVPTKPGATPLPGITPGAAKDETMTYVAIGAGVVALAGIGFLLLRKPKTKKAA